MIECTKAMESWETKTPFRQLIEKDESITNVLSKEELDECFNPEHHLNQVDTIFKTCRFRVIVNGFQ